MNTAYQIEDKVFQSIIRLVYDQAGISLNEKKKALVSARLGKRIRLLGLKDHSEYLQHLKSDASGDELVQMLDAISTNFTSFFREPEHFDYFDTWIKSWYDQGQRKFRIWCAAASSGEEPYTLSMVLKNRLGDKSDVKVLATDISTRVLEKARNGIYSGDKFENVPADFFKKYFDPLGNDLFRAKGSIRNLLHFNRLNLNKPPYPMKGPMDIVFCRNVMIYFDNEVRQKVINEIERLLKPGGYLVIGHSESLTAIRSNFRTIKPSVYQKV